MWMYKFTVGDSEGMVEENLKAELGGLDRLTMTQIRERYLERFPDEFGTPHRQYLLRRIAWRLQAAAYGGISDAALARALEIADEAELKGKPRPALVPIEPERQGTRKRPRTRQDVRLPPLGTELTRFYRDRTIVTTIAAKGFLYKGQTYPSLSSVARAATGTRWNGLLFFGLAKRGDSPRTASTSNNHAEDAA